MILFLVFLIRKEGEIGKTVRSTQGAACSGQTGREVMKLSGRITGQIKLPALSLSTPRLNSSFSFFKPLPQLSTGEKSFPLAFTDVLPRWGEKTRRHLLLGSLAYLSILDGCPQ